MSDQAAHGQMLWGKVTHFAALRQEKRRQMLFTALGLLRQRGVLLRLQDTILLCCQRLLLRDGLLRRLLRRRCLGQAADQAADTSEISAEVAAQVAKPEAARRQRLLRHGSRDLRADGRGRVGIRIDSRRNGDLRTRHVDPRNHAVHLFDLVEHLLAAQVVVGQLDALDVLRASSGGEK